MASYSRHRKISFLLTVLIALVWLVNGLFCKVLDLVPRHREIVGRILGESHADWLTLMIGLGEVAIAFWVISRLFPKVCVLFQSSLIITMNLLEMVFVTDTLLWGKWNILFAMMFCAFLLWKEFVFEPVSQKK